MLKINRIMMLCLMASYSTFASDGASSTASTAANGAAQNDAGKPINAKDAANVTITTPKKNLADDFDKASADKKSTAKKAGTAKKGAEKPDFISPNTMLNKAGAASGVGSTKLSGTTPKLSVEIPENKETIEQPKPAGAGAPPPPPPPPPPLDPSIQYSPKSSASSQAQQAAPVAPPIAPTGSNQSSPSPSRRGSLSSPTKNPYKADKTALFAKIQAQSPHGENVISKIEQAVASPGNSPRNGGGNFGSSGSPQRPSPSSSPAPSAPSSPSMAPKAPPMAPQKNSSSAPAAASGPQPAAYTGAPQGQYTVNVYGGSPVFYNIGGETIDNMTEAGISSIRLSGGGNELALGVTKAPNKVNASLPFIAISVGYDHVQSNLLLGLQAGFGMDLGNVTIGDVKYSNKMFGYLKSRVGYTFKNVTVGVTAGFVLKNDQFTDVKESKLFIKPTVGGFAELNAAPNMNIGVQFDYVPGFKGTSTVNKMSDHRFGVYIKYRF